MLLVFAMHPKADAAISLPTIALPLHPHPAVPGMALAVTVLPE
jgi:hypothetical protein